MDGSGLLAAICDAPDDDPRLVYADARSISNVESLTVIGCRLGLQYGRLALLVTAMPALTSLAVSTDTLERDELEEVVEACCVHVSSERPRAGRSPVKPNVFDRLQIWPIPAAPTMSEGAPRVVYVEGTLSLLDWRPTSPTSESESAIPVVSGPSVIIFDCETTGTDRVKDQIIELCIQRGLSDDCPSTEIRTWRIKPDAPIHPGAQAVHGIKLEELEGCPTFAALADEIAAAFATADVIVGYNITFDIDMLQAEYARIGKPLLDFTSKKIVDAFRLWQQCEPRSLQHAHQRFVGNAFEAAHTASGDVAATARVLSGMLRAFELDGQDWDQIAIKADPLASARSAWVGPSRHLRWENEVVVIGFGKHGNTPIHELAAGPDRSFLTWMLERDFPTHVTEVCRAALELPSAQFLVWARNQYGQAAPTERPPFAKGTQPG